MTSSSSHSDPAANSSAGDHKRSIDIGRVLGASLPGLGPDELQGLESAVRSELESRVGRLLSASLSESQLVEFEKLIDSDDPAATSRWMDQNLPDHVRTTEVATAGLIGQTISYVAKKVPEVLRGESDLVHVVPVNLDLVRSHFDRKGFTFGGDEDVVLTSFGMPGDQPSVSVQVSVVEGDPAVVSLIALARDQLYPTDDIDALREFAHELNRKSVVEMSYVRGDPDGARLCASAGLVLPERVTMDSFDSVMASTIFRLMTPFRRLWHTTDGGGELSEQI